MGCGCKNCSRTVITPTAGTTIVYVNSTITTISYDLLNTSTINLNPYSGELIILLSKSPTPTIGTLNVLSNFTNVTKITIKPQGSLVLTVNDSLASAIKLYTSSLTLYGAMNGFLELTKTGSVFYQTNYIDQYNP